MLKKFSKLSLATKLFCAGLCLSILSLVVLLIAGGANLIPFNKTLKGGQTYGILPGIWWYMQSFNIDFGWTGTGHLVWGTTNFIEMIVISLEFCLFLVALFGMIRGCLKKDFKKIGIGVVAVLVTMYVAYLLISCITWTTRNWMWRSSYAAYLFINTFAILGLALIVAPLFMDVKKVVVGAATEAEPKVEEKKEEVKAEQSLSEADVERIVKEYLDKHVDEKHAVKAEPAVEKVIVVEKVVEEKKPEPKVEVKPEVKEEEEEVPFIKGKAKRRTSFETRLKKSEYDLRHQYYDLRDYIKSYGVKNRISIPGDTFSAHREKLVFITISGKHLKVCYALNPDDYAESPIPVKRNESKKFADLPCELHVKSSLSFRRACKLVDDVMAIKGFTKPEEKK